MKIAGWIITVIGFIAFLGGIMNGHPLGPIVFLAIGIILIYKAKQKEKKEKDLDEWSNKK